MSPLTLPTKRRVEAEMNSRIPNTRAIWATPRWLFFTVLPTEQEKGPTTWII